MNRRKIVNLPNPDEILDENEDDYLMEGYQPGNVRDDEDYDDPVWEDDNETDYGWDGDELRDIQIERRETKNEF